MQEHIAPFKACAKTIEMVMVAHLHCTCFEKDVIPTSLSKNAISYLRNLGFDGVAISDDMVMSGADIENACERGIRAGLNMFIYRNSTPETIEIIEKIAEKAKTDKELRENIEKSYEKIIKLKKLFNILL